jgi:hypothetical protein
MEINERYNLRRRTLWTVASSDELAPGPIGPEIRRKKERKKADMRNARPSDTGSGNKRK